MKKFEIKWCNKEVVVGKGQKVLVNQLVGINDVTEYNDCIAKIDMWDKENEGPDIETVAKIAMKPLAEGIDQRVIHYNHEKGINLWKELNKEKAIQLLNNYHTSLNTDNTYEFEY